MPAEADLLCEYFISSKLNKKKSQEPPISTASVLLKLNNAENSQSITTSAFSSNTASFESIDFVKYEKNPMDYLKSKYLLLNSSNSNSALNNNKIDVEAESKKSIQLNLNGETKKDLTNNGMTSVVKNNETESSTLLNFNWSSIKKNGIGLYNIGNNCYLNATLQCLAYTAPFSQWLITKTHSKLCKLKKQKGFCSLCDVERIIYDIFNSCNGCAKPNSLCMNIKKISTVFGVGRQEDASEFFTTLIENMNKSINFDASPLGKHPNKNKMDNKKRPSTILDEIFSFQFRSRVTCSNCNRVSDTIENNNTWPVDVKHNNDIRKGMIQFLRQEILDGHNAYRCDNCHKKTRATKQYSIRRAPSVLVVHLKRFDFSVMGKLSHYVSYPELLNLKNLTQVPSLSTTDEKKGMKTSVYKLYGVLVHLGHTSRSGHYYSYVRAPNDSWYRADDSRVNKVQASEAMSQRAYILFYKRVVQAHSTSALNGQNQSATTSIKPKFDLEAKSPFYQAKLNGTKGELKQNLVENGERISRESVSNNLLNQLVTSNIKASKEKQAYSYSSPKSPLKANGTSQTNSISLQKKDDLVSVNGNVQENHIKSTTDEYKPFTNGQNNHQIRESENDLKIVDKKKLTPRRKLKNLNEKILALKSLIKERISRFAKVTKKEIKLKKLIKRRKLLKKSIKERKKSKDMLKPAIVPKFSTINANLEKPLNIEKTKAYCEDNSEETVLNSLKEAASISSLKTWNDEESSLLISKVKKSVKRPYDQFDDDQEMDSDEYNEDFDKPQIREKKPKFLKKKNQNGFHKFTHGLNGKMKKQKYNDSRSLNGSGDYNNINNQFKNASHHGKNNSFQNGNRKFNKFRNNRHH